MKPSVTMHAFNQKSLLKTCNDEGEAMMGLNDFFDGVVHADEELPEGSDENSGKLCDGLQETVLWNISF